MNDVKKQFFREIKRLLPCNAKEKNRCIMDLERDVDDFLENCPSATLEVLALRLEHPNQSLNRSWSGLILNSYPIRCLPKGKLQSVWLRL